MRYALIVIVLLSAFGSIGCSTAPSSAAERSELAADARATLDRFKRVNPKIYKAYNDEALGKAVFPTVGKGAIGVGGAYGKGVLYQGNRLVGYCDLTQATIGLQLGGQAYSEIIFFEDKKSLGDFKASRMEFSAQVSAVALTADASSNANFDNGVAVFTIAGKGLMYEASLGGQQFTYKAKSEVE